MEKIYVNSIKEICKSKFPIGAGKTAVVYMSSDGNCIKIYKHNYDGKELLSTENFDERLEKISMLSSNRVIGPKQLLYIKGKLAGYIYEYIKAHDFENVSRFTKVEELFKDLLRIKEEIVNMSNNNFKIGDLHSRNILFNNGQYYFIDLDKGRFDYNDTVENLISYNLKRFSDEIFNKIYGLDHIETGIYKCVDVDKYMGKDLFNEDSINSLLNEYKEVCENDKPTIQHVRKATLVRKETDSYKLRKQMNYL